MTIPANRLDIQWEVMVNRLAALIEERDELKRLAKINAARLQSESKIFDDFLRWERESSLVDE